MSETHPTRTPDHSSSSAHLPPIEGAPDFLQLDKIEELRARQEAFAADKVSEIDPLDYENRVAKRVEAYKENPLLVEEFLKENGVKSDDPKFGEYAAFLREYSIEEIPDTVWEDGATEEDVSGRTIHHPPLKLGVYEKVRETYGDTEPTSDDSKPETDPAASPDDADKKEADDDKEPTPAPDEEKDDADKDDDKDDDPAPTIPIIRTDAEIKALVAVDPEIQKKGKEVAALRTQLAKMAAKRQRSLGSKQETVDEYNTARDAYQTALSELVKAELAAEIKMGRKLETDEEKEDARFEVTNKLLKGFQDLQSETLERMRNTKVGKFVEFMNKGGTTMRIVKGLGVGLVAGGVAAAISAASLGTASGALAGAAVYAGRFARGYARFDAKKPGMEILDADSRSLLNESDAGNRSAVESVDVVHEHLMKTLDEETKREQKNRRAAVGKAMAVVALGSGAAWALSHATDGFGLNRVGEGVRDRVSGWFNDDVEAKAPTPDVDKDGSGTGSVPDAEPDTTPNWNESRWNDASTIQNGEGFFQTMQEMNIPAEDRPALLREVGPQLQDIQGPDGQPIAYKMPNGEWGIRMTPDGKMPPEALDLIHQTHEQMQGDGSGADASSTAESAAGDTPSSGDIEFTDSPDTSTSVETIPDTPATPDSIDDKIDTSTIQSLAEKNQITAQDITNNRELMELSHVATWYPPEAIGQKLGLSAAEWNNVAEYITAQTENENKLYTNAFTVENGYLKFTGNRIPAETMADMLTRARVALAA